MRNNKVELSIIIPAFNAEKTIKRCLDSVVSQDAQQIEAIVIDDGSKDSTPQIIQKYCQKYDFIRYCRIENSGVSKARNKGMELSSGQYLLFLDADDELKKNMCSKMIDVICSFNVDMVVCGFLEMEGEREKKEYRIPTNWCNKILNIQDAFEPLFWGLHLNQPWNKLYRKDKIQKGFNQAKQNGEDLEFVLEFLRGQRKLVVISDCLYLNHIDNPNSLSRNYSIVLKNLKVNQLDLVEYLESESIPINHHSISDYLLSQIWSNSVLGVKAGQLTLKNALEQIDCDQNYIKLISSLKPEKIGNRVVRFLLANRLIIPYQMFLKLLLFIK